MGKCLEDGIKNIVFDLGQVLLKYDWETGDKGVVTPEEWEIAKSILMQQQA